MDTDQGNRFGGRFTEWAPLGGGAEANLYRVRDVWTDRYCALKIPADPSEEHAIVHEFKLLSNLRHPCLIESQDLVWDDLGCGHLLEFLPAEDPKKIWSLGGEEAVLSALTQTLRAVSYLHRLGFVHADISPGNILIWKEGERWRSKLADLGLTLSIEGASSASLRGTPNFMAPEVAVGKGFGPAADFYSLALTAVTWVDGQSPWGSIDPGALLRKLNQLPDVPRPKRVVSVELQSILTSLGCGEPSHRDRGDFQELRVNQAVWGPPVLHGTIVGVGDCVETITDWIEDEVPNGQVGILTIKGRVGTGRHTLATAASRFLATKGWNTMSDVLGTVLKDWLARVDSAPDPVTLAQELANRFASRDLVIVSSSETEVELRLLQSLLELRDLGGEAPRTLLIRTASITSEPDELRWTTRFPYSRTLDWPGPDQAALELLCRDLHCEEGGVESPANVSTPLSAETQKKLALRGQEEGSVDQDLESIQRETAEIWRDASLPLRDVLGVLCLSPEAWTLRDLQVVLNLDESSNSWTTELERTRITRITYERQEPSVRISDWMTRQAIVSTASKFFDERLQSILDRIVHAGVHKCDLALATECLRRDAVSLEYLSESLDYALSIAQYNEVMAAWEVLKANDIPAEYLPLLERCLLATQKLGKHSEEAMILRLLLDGATVPSEATRIQKMLAQNLRRSGRWHECIQVCKEIGVRARDQRDAIWSKLEVAEALWQAGQFNEATREYEEVEGNIPQSLEEEWLRYAVGRARQSGQQGNLDLVEQYLEQAESKLGTSRCSQDPMYLHTLAGLKIQKGEYTAAKALIDDSMKRFAESRSWVSFVMASLRAATIEHGLGDPRGENRVARKAIAVASALGSELAWGRMRGSMAHAQLYLGEFGNALNSSGIQREIADRLKDRTMQIQARRSSGETSSHAGWAAQLQESVEFLRTVGGEIGDRECVAKADVYDGVFQLGQHNWSGAYDLLSVAVDELGAQGRLDDMLRTRLFLSVALRHLGRTEAAVSEVEEVFEALDEISYPALEPVAKLARAAALGSVSGEDGESGAAELWANGNLLDYFVWVPEALGAFSNGSVIEARRNLLSAVQKMADTIRAKELRKEFLSFPRTKGTLMLVAS